MTPLDRRVDFLTLPGGQKFEIPFELIVVFATNLDPNELADEAFLRRIPNKIKIDYATPAQFVEIFRNECGRRLLDCDDAIVQHAMVYHPGNEAASRTAISSIRSSGPPPIWTMSRA